MAALGEPIIQRQGNDRIIVELPGIQDTARAKELLGATATLEYRAVVEGDAYGAMNGGVAPLGSRVYLMRKQNPSDPDVPVLLSKRVIVSGDQLVNASPTVDSKSGTPAVEIKLNAAGGKRMFAHTQRNVGKPMAVVYIERKPITRIIEGKPVRGSVTEEFVINTATIQSTFSNAFITTGLDQVEAKKLSDQLKSGSLAAPVDIVAEQIIGPSLGAENVKRGVQAVVFSFAFVLVFFLIYYKMFGVITNVALLLQLLMVVAILSYFGATMTLPGFAGIALTVGMSVDANVLINERIREELRLGNTPLASIAAGYDKATGTIADANITALLAGLAMAVFGSGPISGFGITLIIGIVTSMYTAVAVSRGIATLIYGSRRKMTGLSI
jgi:preprotein translocase subunit SecD